MSQKPQADSPPPAEELPVEAGRKFLGATDILEAEDRTPEDLYVPEWKGWVKVWPMSGAERDALDSAMVALRGNKREVNTRNVRARVLFYSCKDEKGRRIFTIDQLDKLSEKSAAAIERVFDVASRLSRLGSQDIEALTAELPNDQSGNSGSA